MAASFTTLASGSSGNAALVRNGQFGLLIDIGIGPRTLGKRLQQAGFCWNDINAVVLTHTHGDHWRETTLTHVAARGIPVICHESHCEHLNRASETFAELHHAGRVTTYHAREPLSPGGKLDLLPLEVEHDSHRTFGFRIAPRDGDWTLGYVADLGRFDDRLLDALCDLDLLALEFNHDEDMQRTSGRPQMLIDRVLGPRGHLSNRQAATLLQSLLGQSGRSRLKTLVSLHLSRDCNRPELAERSARESLARCGSSATVVIARRDCANQRIALGTDQSPIAAGTRDLFDELDADTTSPAAGTSMPPLSR